MTDAFGVYTGTLGGPMPAGTYALRAVTIGAADASISVVLGPSALAKRSCEL